MSHGPSRDGGLDGLIHDIADMGGPHDPFVVGRDISKDFDQIDILLVMRADQIMKRMPRNREYGLAVAFGVIQSVQQVQSTRAGCRQAHAEPPGEFRIAACRKGGGFLVAHLNDFNAALPTPEGFKNTVDAVAWKTEDRVHFPVDEAIHQQICNGVCHINLHSRQR
jgi:hypothetical protein